MMRGRLAVLPAKRMGWSILEGAADASVARPHHSLECQAMHGPLAAAAAKIKGCSISGVADASAAGQRLSLGCLVMLVHLIAAAAKRMGWWISEIENANVAG